MKDEYPKTKRLSCGCYEEDWGNIIRTDFCDTHAKENIKILRR